MDGKMTKSGLQSGCNEVKDSRIKRGTSTVARSSNLTAVDFEPESASHIPLLVKKIKTNSKFQKNAESVPASGTGSGPDVQPSW